MELEEQKEQVKGMKPKEAAMNLHCAPIPGSAAPSKYLCLLLSLDVQLVSPWISYIPNMSLVNSSVCWNKCKHFCVPWIRKCTNASFERTKLTYIFQWLLITLTSSPNSWAWPKKLLVICQASLLTLSCYSSSHSFLTCCLHLPCSSHTQRLSLAIPWHSTSLSTRLFPLQEILSYHPPLLAVPVHLPDPTLGITSSRNPLGSP